MVLRAPCIFNLNSLQYGYCLWILFDHGGLGWMDVDCVWTAKDPSVVPEGRKGALSFLSSNPYNIGVYWLLLTF